MIRFTRSSIVPLLLLGIAAGGLRGQEEASAPKLDPELKEKLKEFRSAIYDRKRGRDSEAHSRIDKFLKAYQAKTMHPKDQASVRKALQDCLLSPKVKRDPEHRGLFNAAAIALGRMGPEASKSLVKAFGSPKFKGREWVAMRAVFLKSTGKTKDLKQVGFLVERASREHEDKLLQAAGEALGNFADADQKVRKAIVKDLIKKFNEIDGQSRASLDPGNSNVKRAKERLAAISRDWNQTLRRLTRQSLSSPTDWNRFYNKNKNKNWDKLK